MNKSDYLTNIDIASKKSELDSDEETITGKITKADEDDGTL